MCSLFPAQAERPLCCVIIGLEELMQSLESSTLMQQPPLELIVRVVVFLLYNSSSEILKYRNIKNKARQGQGDFYSRRFNQIVSSVLSQFEELDLELLRKQFSMKVLSHQIQKNKAQTRAAGLP